MKSVEAINWTVKDLTTTYYGGIRSADPKLLVLPTYQRSYVWNLTQRYKLVESLKKGWPVGALIVRSTGEMKKVNHNGIERDVPTYELIDGQQRSTSLILHSLFPLAILEVEGMFKTDPDDGLNFLDRELDTANIRCDAIQNRISAVLGRNLGENWFKDKIRDQLIKCFKRDTFESKDGATTAFTVKVLDKNMLTFTNFRNALSPTLGLEISEFSNVIPAGSSEETNFVSFLSNIQQSLNIDDEVIPVISWSGHREDAPSVFVRVNQGGVKLKKEQVLAASFAHTVTDIDRGRVQQLADKVLRPEVGVGLLEQIPNDSNDLHIDLYAALIGLGEQLVDEHPEFFKKKPSPVVRRKDEDDEEDVEIIAGNHARVEHYYAFNIVTLMMQLPLSLKGMQKMDAAIEEIVGVTENRIKFTQIAEAVMNSANLVCKKLEIIAKSTAKSEKIFEAAHTELGFAALIARYAVEFLEGRTPTGEAIIGHYLNDSLKGINEGTAHNDDHAAFTRVWSTLPDGADSDKNKVKLNPRYLNMIPNPELGTALDDYWRNSKQRALVRLSRRTSVEKEEKMLLKFYARSKISHGRYVSIEKFEIDHSVPLSWIKGWEDKNEGAFYGAGLIGNLAVLPRNVNSKKSDRTLDQFEDSGDRMKYFPLDDLFEMVPYSQGDLTKRGWSLTDGPTPGEFMEFVESNWTTIKAHILGIATDSTVLG